MECLKCKDTGVYYNAASLETCYCIAGQAIQRANLQAAPSPAIEQQAAPIHNDETSIWQLVIEDMRARENFGAEKYKTVLQINDGRDHLVDHYQELLDACVYIRQEIEERRRRQTVVKQCAIIGFEQMKSFVRRYYGEGPPLTNDEREFLLFFLCMESQRLGGIIAGVSKEKG